MLPQCKHEIGTTILEILTTLIVGAPLIIGLTAAVTAAIEAHQKTRVTSQEISHVTSLKAILTPLFEHVSAHRLPLPARIHPDGTIAYTDGTTHPIVNHPRFHPAPQSNGVSALELAIRGTLDLHQALPNEALEICSRWGESPPSDTRLLLALSVDGALLTAATLHRTSATPCFEAHLSPIPSTVVPISPATLTTATTFIPVVREYSVYLSHTGEIRYLSHRGFETPENQPLLRGFKAMQISITAGAASLPPAYRVSLQLANGPPWSLDFLPPSTYRSTLFTFLGARR